MHRLAGSLLMSDTCNAARATKRLLASGVEAAAQAKIGKEAWGAMNEAEQAAAARNIILAAISAAGAAQHLKN
eukprot:2849764-Pleurochrysis_carterae.AAC.1